MLRHAYKLQCNFCGKIIFVEATTPGAVREIAGRRAWLSKMRAGAVVDACPGCRDELDDDA